VAANEVSTAGSDDVGGDDRDGCSTASAPVVVCSGVSRGFIVPLVRRSSPGGDDRRVPVGRKVS
jgi:hypothetical protein